MAKEIYGHLAVLKLLQIAAFDCELHAAARRILNIIGGYADTNGHAFPSISKIAQSLNMTRAAITKQIRKLEEHNYLESQAQYREGGNGRLSNIYILNLSLAIEHHTTPDLFATNPATSIVTAPVTSKSSRSMQQLGVTTPDTSSGCTKINNEKNIKKEQLREKRAFRETKVRAQEWQDSVEKEEKFKKESPEQKILNELCSNITGKIGASKFLKIESALMEKTKHLSKQEAIEEQINALKDYQEKHGIPVNMH